MTPAPAPEAGTLAVRGLRTVFASPQGPLTAVDGVDLDLAPGEILGLVGESGSGKSVTLRSLLRLVHPPGRVAGTVLWGGRDLLGLGAGALRRVRGREIATVFQEPMTALNPVLTVGRQIDESLRAHTGLDARGRRARAVELLDLVGIPAPAGRLADYPHQFSGGMRQRAAIALALALRPKLVIADEPVTALDVIVQRQVLDTLRGLGAAFGLSAIVVTHDISVVAYLCEVTAVMYAGRIVEVGPTADVLRAPAHPYTMGLMNASPDIADVGGLLVPIRGAPPNLADPPPGCRFAPRCPFARDACRATDPARVAVAPDHASACLRAGEAAALRPRAREAATWLR